MATFRQLLNNPPKIEVKKGAREVIFKTVSAMCDNVDYLTFKKNSDGDFKLNSGRFALSNWQMKYPQHDLEWAADEGDWTGVVEMINSGTSRVESVKSR